ncbi:allatostatin-A receptor-like [Centruroides sculpturatus]|uniref:allatostatin-A receptor-like n=1 Tax=Centruroides sculpturatus TaxID=218467 RepID=UPI000C6E5C39|nr:allatostatin-A receptor-like [Centruroides sculpturatus]
MTDEDIIELDSEIRDSDIENLLVKPTALYLLNDTIKRICNFTNNSRSFCNSTDDYDRHDYSDAEAMEKLLSIIVPILFGIIFIVGLFGNSLVVIVVLCNPQMRSTTNLLIINLAVADLLFIVFCVPFTAWDYALPYWPFGDAWCKVVQYLVIVCAYASIYTLVLMSLDRFLAVVHPITSISLRTERNALIAIFLVWIVILLSCVPALKAHGEFNYMFAHAEYSMCIFLVNEGYNHAMFQICFFLSSYVIPLSLIFALYLLMLKRLWFGVAPGGHVSSESVRSKKRVTRMVVVVVVIFAVCWCPVHIVLVMKGVEAYRLTPVGIAIQIAAQILAYMNSCVNPILYAFLSDNFRKAFRKVIACNPRMGRTRRGDYERTERETMGTCATKSSTTKTSNDIL